MDTINTPSAAELEAQIRAEYSAAFAENDRNMQGDYRRKDAIAKVAIARNIAAVTIAMVVDDLQD